MKRMIATAALLACFGVAAKDLPPGGKAPVTHDYQCVSVSTGRNASMTVQELPGSATQMTIAEGAKKSVTVTLSAMDDQAGMVRLYKYGSSDGSTEILQISSFTGIATTTMLHSVGREAFTSLVCNEDK